MALVDIQEVITLSLQLFDGDTGKYPLCAVFNDQQVQIPGSPFSLPHVGGGMYQLNTVRMPAGDFVVAQYKVYSDPGHTIISPIHGDAQDVFYTERIRGAFILEAELVTDNALSAELVTDDTLEASLLEQTNEAEGITQSQTAEILTESQDSDLKVVVLDATIAEEP